MTVEGDRPQRAWPMRSIVQDPAVRFTDDEDRLIIHVRLSGMDDKDLKIDLSSDSLTLCGSRTRESREEREGMFRQARMSSSFSRTVSLPARVVAEKASAHVMDGVLEIDVPKAIVHGKGEQETD